MDKREKTVIFCTLAVLLCAVFLSLAMGVYPVSVSDIFRIIAGKGENAQKTVFIRLRIPRMAAGVCAGAVLGVTGAVCQSVFSSPLASPDITGVASGASFGAAAAIVLGFSGPWARTVMAFASGIAALVLLLLLVKFTSGERRSTYILAGIIISALADAALMTLKTLADPEGELAAVEFWTMGSFAAITWKRTAVMLISSLPALVMLLLFSRQVLMLSRGSDEARQTGLSPNVWRGIILLLSTWAVAGVVSVTGVIGFAGLIVPHIAMFLYKRRSGAYFYLCAIIGSIVILLADIAARMVSPGEELPISIFCVAFASAVLIALLIKGRVQNDE